MLNWVSIEQKNNWYKKNPFDWCIFGILFIIGVFLSYLLVCISYIVVLFMALVQLY